jgi:Uma2 family endonuclease
MYMSGEIAPPLPEHHRFTTQEFERMSELGILSADTRFELIGGEIIQMSPIGWKHMRCVNNLNRMLVLALVNRAIVSIQNPIVLSERDEPQPDVAILHLSANEHSSIPLPADVSFVIEVADSTLQYDKRVKLPLYARAGIIETWIVDVDREAISQHVDPVGDSYDTTTTFYRADTIVSHAFPDLRLGVQDTLP